MNQSDKLSQWVNGWGTVSAEGLALLRIFTALFILFFLIPGNGMDHFRWLGELPSELYAPPPGPMMFFDGFPEMIVFQGLYSLLIISLLAMLIGYRTKWASILTGIVILSLQGIMFSIGKINHEILIAAVPFVMAFSNWGIRFSVDSHRNKTNTKTPEHWPVLILAILIGFMMFTAGFPKILGGWLDPSTQASYGHLLNQYFPKGRQALLAGYFVNFQFSIFWEAIDWLTVLFEIGFLASVYKAKWFRKFLCLAVVFHFSTLLSLNIAFLPNFLAYAIFLDWEKIYKSSRIFYNRITGNFGEKPDIWPVLFYTGFITLFFFILVWLSRKDIVLATSELHLFEVVLLTIALVIVIVQTVHFMAFQRDNAEQFE